MSTDQTPRTTRTTQRHPSTQFIIAANALANHHLSETTINRVEDYYRGRIDLEMLHKRTAVEVDKLLSH